MRYAGDMFTFTPELARRMIDDEPALHTLTQYSIEEVWSHLEDPGSAADEGEAFDMLMQVMYELRPVGYL